MRKIISIIGFPPKYNEDVKKQSYQDYTDHYIKKVGNLEFLDTKEIFQETHL